MTSDGSMGTISVPQLTEMQPTTFLMECARGPLADEPAFVEVLRQKVIADAGLEVFEPEPALDDHPLYQLLPVIVTPHLAGVTREARTRMSVGATEQWLQMLRGMRPP